MNSDHFDGKRFFNPAVDTDRSLGELLRWRMSRQPGHWPDHVTSGGARPVAVAGAGEIVATYIGQATFLVQAGGLNVLTDPIFSLRASPVAWLGPKRVRPPAIDFDALPPIHLVLVSHNHYDHMDLPSLRRLHRHWAPTIVTGLGNGRYLTAKGIGGVVELDWWQSHAVRPGVSVTYVPAQHWSKRGFFDRRTMLWGGHIINFPVGRVYFAGDTGYPAQFAEISRRLGPPDIALLPIGAYEPRWFMGPQHMNPDDAVRAHNDLRAGLSIAMHFGTFPLADEAMDAPILALGEARARHGVPAEDFVVPVFGQPLSWRRGGRQ